MTSNCPENLTPINDLPNELLASIFEYLKIKDLMRCSLVCKRFKLICQDVKIPELIISNTIENIKDFWFYTHKQFNHQDAIDVTTFNSYRSIFRLDKFRRLYFEGSHTEYIQLNVNDLTQLEQMKIRVGHKDTDEHKFHFNLPNLKIIDIHTHRDSRQLYRSRYKFMITAPTLEILCCTDFDGIHLSYPSTVKHLKTEFYQESFHVLKNLQFLFVEVIPMMVSCLDILSTFPKLSILSCNARISREIENFVQYKRDHQKSEPKIYFLHVEINDIKQIEDHHKHHDLVFQLINYNSLAETVSVESLSEGIDYNDVMAWTKGKLPDDFFKKYFCNQVVTVRRNVEDQEHLLGFLKNFEYLTELTLGTDSLDQSFYDRLCELDQLTVLEIDSVVTPTNFDFLFTLKRLKTFAACKLKDAESEIFFDLTPKLFTHLKYLQLVAFYFKWIPVYVNKDVASNTYSFHGKPLNFDELIQQLQTIKSRGMRKE